MIGTRADTPRQGASAWSLLARFLPEFRPHLARIAAAYLCGVVAVAATLAAPWPLKFIIDCVLGGAPAPAWLSAVLPHGESGAVVLLASALLAIGVIGTVFAGLEQYFNARIVERLSMQLRDRLLGHILTLPLAHRSTDKTGELSLRLVDDVAQFVRLLGKTLPMVARHFATALLAFAALFALQPMFGAVSLIVFAVNVVLTRRYATPLRAASKLKRRREGEVAGLAQEIIRGLPSVMALGAEPQARAQFSEAAALSGEAGMAEARRGVAMERTLEVVKAIGRSLILCGGGLLVLDGAMTIGDLTVGVAYLASLMKPMAKVNELASTISRGLARGELLAALLDREPDITNAPNALAIGRARGEVEFREVSFSYPPSSPDEPAIPILKDVSLRIEPGEFLAIVGPSGAGKSTLLSLLLRLQDPTRGQILLDGAPITRIRIDRLRAQFAPMLQEIHVFSGKLREALSPTGAATDAMLWTALEQVRMAEFARRTPGGLDGRLAENGVNLSGGQRARLSLARALLLDAPILLLDEPLANVDPESQEVILETLAGLRGERGCVAVTHQPALTRLADRVLELEDGQLEPLSAQERRVRLAVAQ